MTKKEFKLYKVTADYRPIGKLNHLNSYKLYAKTKAEARKIFKNIMSWLDVIKIEEMSEDERVQYEKKYKRFILNYWVIEE